MKLCLLVPHYDHVAQFRRLLPSLVTTNLPIVIVDDASPAGAVAELERLVGDCGGEIGRESNSSLSPVSVEESLETGLVDRDLTASQTLNF